MMTSNPQRMAWLTLIGAFVLFCGLCTGSAVLARWLILESPTDLTVRLHVGKGTVALYDPNESGEKAVRSPTAIDTQNRLSTDTLSQGYLAFSDPYSGDMIATITLHNSSAVTVETASRPRFSLSENPYRIRLVGMTGRLEVWTSDALERRIEIEIDSSLGRVYISQGGNFWIENQPAELRVTARVGTLTLVGTGQHAQLVAQGSQGVITTDDPQAITMLEGPIDLLPNWDFGASKDWPVGWACAWDPSPDNETGPAGHYSFPHVSGRGAIHIERMMPNPGPGETVCVQVPGGSQGLDVSQYASLRLRVTMQIGHQSLSACGAAGSECPVMLRVTFQNGIEWYHGFYAEFRPAEGGLRICDSCLEAHEQINKDAWYTYESANLITDLPPEYRPSLIQEIKFYSGGHQYDVLLREVALVAVPATP